MDNLFSLHLYDASQDTKFPARNLDLWVANPVFKTFISEFGKDETSPIYITIRSNEPLNPFTIHTTLQSLNNQSDFPKNNVYISKDVKHSDWIMKSGINVSFTEIKEKELNIAKAITIKLNKDEVVNWSEDESRFGENNFRVHNRIAYKSQKVWIKTATKKPTLAEVINVIPAPKNEFNSPLIVTEDTKIIFEGLPENQQTVIDFSKIGGLDNLIQKLREIIQVPLQYPEVLNRFDIKPPKGLLLFGPPGNGKTMIARAVSYSMGAKFISIEGPELMSKYVGVAESQLRDKFEEAEKLGNCVIFIDEIDSIAANRENVTAEHNISIVSTLLNLMDGIKPRSGVFVIGATNRLNSVDPALRRPGRFDLEFEVPIPNLTARLDILSKYIDISNANIIDNTINEAFIQMLSELTNGYSGADILALYRESVMNAIRDELNFDTKTGKIDLKSEPAKIRLTRQHFMKAIKSITPTSLRGIDINRNHVAWDDLLCVDKQKQELFKLHNLLLKNPINLISKSRPSLLNVLFTGTPGSGRKTLINSFASKFNYELFNIDLLNIASQSQEDAFSHIEEIFTKAKQVAPSIIYLLNIQYIGLKELVFRKIFMESLKYNIHNKVLLVIEIENSTEIPQFLKGHKAFNNDIVFDSYVPEKELPKLFKEIEDKYGMILSLKEFTLTYKNKPIGQIISEISDRIVSNSN